MSRIFQLFLYGLFLSLPSVAQHTFSIIPQPLKLTAGMGYFTVDAQTTIYLPQTNSQELVSIGELLSQRFRLAGGFFLDISMDSPKKGLVFVTDTTFAEEAYRLTVGKEMIEFRAATPRGHFYAVQTFLQIVPPAIFAGSGEQETWKVPVCVVEDAPRFKYRGMHLDVGRHFFSVDFIKKYIDLLAMHKMNTFHWHLTEDQGWRIEIKKYPKLTEVGSIRKETMKGHYRDQQWDGTPYGGFYTQDQIREVVAYASKKFVEVIPEIEMPGHALAALAAYPEFGCTGGPYQVGTRWGIEEDVFCPYEETFVFLEDVLTEVMGLFPSKYIHIGGDESPKTTWQKSAFCQELIKKEGLKDEHELQSYFIKRIDAFLTSKGRKMIGWDEILEGGISPNATIMSWRGEEGGVAAAKQQHEAIMTPTSFVYFDYYQSDPMTEPLAIGGFLPLDKVYQYEPIPAGLTKEEEKYIIGTQGNVWTEYIPTPSQLEYMAFPRASALAEVAWTAKENKDYADFGRRLQVQFERFAFMGVNAAKSFFDLQSETTFDAKQKKPICMLKTAMSSPVITYTTDGTEPTFMSKKYPVTGIPLVGPTLIKAAVFNEKGALQSKIFTRFFQISQATGKKYTLENAPQSYTGGERFGLTNGIRGTVENAASWVGFNGKDAKMTLDLGEMKTLSSVKIGFQQAWAMWILLPQSVEILVSMDGKTFEKVKEERIEPSSSETYFVRQMSFDFPAKKARYIQVTCKNQGPLPASHPSAGSPSWLFVDEIEVN